MSVEIVACDWCGATARLRAGLSCVGRERGAKVYHCPECTRFMWRWLTRDDAIGFPSNAAQVIEINLVKPEPFSPVSEARRTVFSFPLAKWLTRYAR
jgi:hypothetical protein